MKFTTFNYLRLANSTIQPLFLLAPKRLSDYSYAYNGMEKDDEVSGGGNSYTTQFRQYDPRLGRWKSLDPMAAKFPDRSPFVAFNNNPIYFVDPLGLEGDGPKKGSESNPHSSDVDQDKTLDDAAANGDISDQYFEAGGDSDLMYKFTYDVETQTWVGSGNYNPGEWTTNGMERQSTYTPKTEVTVKEFKIYPDPEQPTLAIELKFDLKEEVTENTQDCSPYRIVQTYTTNRHVDSSYEPYPGNEPYDVMNVYDFDSRQGPSGITYDENSVAIKDIFFRRVEPGTEIYFRAETSLIRVDNAGNIIIVETRAWGLIINEEGKAYKYGPTPIDDPSDFHLKMIEEGPSLYDMNTWSQPYEKVP